MKTMKIVIPGGSGQVGTVLARALHHEGHDVVVLSRRPQARPWRVLAWDGATLGNWSRELDGCDAVINLAGRSVNCRYTAANRKDILESRVLSTHVVGQAIAQVAQPPRVWLQASTATIYAHRYDAPNDEATGLGDGRQYVSWIHDEDFVAAVRWLLARDEVDGVVNVAAPNPLPHEEFMRVLRHAAGTSFGLPATRLMLEAGAVFLRTETELILKSRRVVPGRLLEHGFVVRYPDWRDAATNLRRRWKLVRQSGARVA